jgi:uncharacterized protein
MVRTLAFALALAATPAAAQLQPGETLLEVEAQGIVRSTPDLATFSMEVASLGASSDAALQANARSADRLVSAALAAGASRGDLKTSDVRVAPRYRQDADGDDTDEVIGYRASERFEVRVPVARAAAMLDALGKAGATEISGPAFSFRDDAPLIRSARAKAVGEANSRADDYGLALGLRRSRVIRVSERNARRLESADIVVTGARAGGAPIIAGEQETTVTVWIDYALVK